MIFVDSYDEFEMKLIIYICMILHRK